VWMALLQLLQRLVLSVARVMERNDGMSFGRMSFDRMGLNRMWFGRGGLTGRAGELKRLKQDAPAGTCSLCFRAGTLVWAATGLVAIDSLAVGDVVLSRDETTGEVSYRPITARSRPRAFGAGVPAAGPRRWSTLSLACRSSPRASRGVP
jgi:hypothetical protein